ncbi:hypothetical protein GX51_02870 [Blastomyces parvus]|uniref:Uncharacterized protein n=1 Tax=Blastomyces parvus TaxID=2060905 RepID=A0A2B7X9X6_9EURO|nr:hypothetical protein GX51_02870 [Blastomyces parvus]
MRSAFHLPPVRGTGSNNNNGIRFSHSRRSCRLLNELSRLGLPKQAAAARWCLQGDQLLTIMKLSVASHVLATCVANGVAAGADKDRSLMSLPQISPLSIPGEYKGNGEFGAVCLPVPDTEQRFVAESACSKWSLFEYPPRGKGV